MPEQEQLAVGDVLDGKYRVEGLIGRGGMGAVYRARHIGLDAPRAIKLMRPELAQDEAFIQRFENEAFLAEGVRHPNVVALYDFASLPDGTKYIVWELVEGETVRDGLERDTVFTSSEVIRLVSQIGGGLAAAHKKGILHRDVSPDNIMICAGSTTDRNAKLLDFGVAKAAGTPKSMADDHRDGLRQDGLRLSGADGASERRRIARRSHRCVFDGGGRLRHADGETSVRDVQHAKFSARSDDRAGSRGPRALCG